MDHTEHNFQDLLLYCTKKVAENHNQFFHFRHGGETHFLVLAQTLIYGCAQAPAARLTGPLALQHLPLLYPARHLIVNRGVPDHPKVSPEPFSVT